MKAIIVTLLVTIFFMSISKKEDCYFSRENQGMFVNFKTTKDSLILYEICNNELCINMVVYSNGRPKKIEFEKEVNVECNNINTIIPTGTLFLDKNLTYNYSHSYPLEYYEDGKYKKRLVNQEESKYYKYISFSPEGDTLSVQYVDKKDYLPQK